MKLKPPLFSILNLPHSLGGGGRLFRLCLLSDMGKSQTPSYVLDVQKNKRNVRQLGQEKSIVLPTILIIVHFFNNTNPINS